MSRIKETGKYIYRIANAELRKKFHFADLILVPDKKYKKSDIMKLKFIKYNPKTKTLTFKVTKRDHKF